MDDFTVVYFKGLAEGFNIPSVAASFSVFGMNFTIHWYGAIIAFGFLLAVLFGGRIAYTWKMNLDKMIDVLIYGTIGGIIGARLYYCIFKWDYYGHHLGDIIKIWNGGLAIYGGLIGGLLGAFIACKIDKLNFLNLMDIASMSFLIGQGIGRWGNFMNQEAFGTNTDLPWGMWSEKVAEYLTYEQAALAEKGITVNPGTYFDKAYVHPTFLYESIWCLLGFVVLYIILRTCRKFSGQLMLTYGVIYGAERAVVEGFRTDSLYIANTTIRVSQLFSAIIAVACLVALIVLLIRYHKNPKPIEGIDYFVPDEKKVKKSKNKKETVAVAAAQEEAQDGTVD